MADEEIKNELERLRAENARLKQRGTRGVSMKVSPKGGLSIYGLGRFPVTLYKEQWVKLLEAKGVYVGSRAPMLLPAGGSFGYAQPAPNTLVKEAMADKNQMMIELGARMVVASLATKTATESRGDQSASTSVLAGCVANVSEAYTRAIMWCCAYMGIADKKVAYQVNQEFVELTADPQMITALVGLWQNGGFAKADLRAYLRKLGLIAPERTDLQIDGELQEQSDGLGLDNEDTPNGGKPSNP